MEQRKHFTSQQKVMILREHLENQVQLSDLSERYGVHINMLYRWKKEFFESAADVFDRKGNKETKAEMRATARLEAKLREKDKLISELIEDNIRLKKT